MFGSIRTLEVFFIHENALCIFRVPFAWQLHKSFVLLRSRNVRLCVLRDVKRYSLDCTTTLHQANAPENRSNNIQRPTEGLPYVKRVTYNMSNKKTVFIPQQYKFSYFTNTFRKFSNLFYCHNVEQIR